MVERNWSFQKQGALFAGSLSNNDYKIVGRKNGYPVFWKLPNSSFPLGFSVYSPRIWGIWRSY